MGVYWYGGELDEAQSLGSQLVIVGSELAGGSDAVELQRNGDAICPGRRRERRRLDEELRSAGGVFLGGRAPGNDDQPALRRDRRSAGLGQLFSAADTRRFEACVDGEDL